MGTASGQLVVLALSPVLSRLYTPDDFGIFTFVVATSAVLSAISTLRFEMAIHEAETDLQVSSLVTTSLLCAALVSFFVSGALLVINATGVMLSIQALRSPWIWSIPVLSFVGAALAVLVQVAVRLQSYKAIGVRNLLQNVLMSLVQLGLGIVGAKAGGLIIGQFTGRSGALLSLFRTTGVPKRILSKSTFRPFSVARAYWKYPVLLSPAALLNALGTQLPFILIGGLYGSIALGLLGFTAKVIAAPVALIGQAFAEVYTGELAKKVRAGEKGGKRLFLKVSVFLGSASAVGVVVLLVAGPEIFALVFGDAWYRSGVFAQAMSVAFGMQLVATPVSRTLILTQAQSLQLTWDATRMVAVALAIFIPYSLGLNAEGTLWVYGITSALCYALLWLICLRRSSWTPASM